jgi:hypothetical protein
MIVINIYLMAFAIALNFAVFFDTRKPVNLGAAIMCSIILIFQFLIYFKEG